MVPRWRIFGDSLGAAFSASRVLHVSDLHLKFAVKATPCTVDIQSVTAEINRAKKKEDRTNYRAKI